jgi:superfamily II DNA or RNA helicase/HKD family nuclease
MGNESVLYRRIKFRHDGLPVEGLYDSVIDARLRSLLETAKSAGIDIGTRELKGRDGRLLARELAAAVIEAIESKLSSDEAATADDIDVVNRLLRVLRDVDGGASSAEAQILPLVLERVGPKKDVGPPDLSDHGLLTGREGTESLLLQLKRELATSDRADWLVSFIKHSAVKMMQADIEGFLRRGGTLRVVTSAYMGATEPKAIEELARISREHGERLRIRFSRDTDATRLHAKAYIHHRHSGFGSAYVGSANLSRPALTEGLEWTVRLSQAASPGLWSKIEETFDQWWGDPEFVEFGLTPDHPTHAQFRELVARQKGALVDSTNDGLSALPIFDLTPKPFQQAILDRIAVERRELARSRHLVVAATGTGKTMIAAFDYRAFQEEFVATARRLPRMLYVAHSERILKQARVSFAQVLRDLNFGGLLVAGHDDRPCNALFASIQSWNSRIGTGSLSADHFDYVVVDEVHHSEAPSWRKLLEWIKPRSLLGLTATPDRADGLDITRHFNDHITAEIRLPDAITRRLLVPFHYFGVTDVIDLRDVDWTSRGYDMDEVQLRYIKAGPQWIEHVRRALFSYVAEPLSMRAIGFCSGVAHAHAMAEEFERVRIDAQSRGQRALRAEALDGSDSLERREEVIGRLRRGETQLIFVADLFNEGVDIPEVDTVIFMRPTDSVTIYLQQLGRGLRLCPQTSKDCLTVLDFVGQYRKEFRFSDRLGAMLADPSVSMEGQVERGFTALPPGCSITLERIAREQILANIRAQMRSQRDRMMEEIKALRERMERTPSQREYLEATRLDPRVFYAKRDARLSWSGLLIGANLQSNARDSADELHAIEPFMAPLRAIASITDRKLVEFGFALLELIDAGHEVPMSLATDRRTEVLLVEFGDAVRKRYGREAPSQVADVIAELVANRPLRSELRSLLDAIAARVVGLAPQPQVPIPSDVPLALHRVYTRRQLFAAFGWESIWRSTPQSGVAWIPEHRAYIMLVTLEKNADSFTERTRYRDYAISPTVFHWQSQATARPDRGDGQRIVHAKSGEGTMWLFVRRSTDDEFGTEPYVFMGAFKPTSIEGMLPMSVTGDLANAMPAEWFEVAARAR